MITFTQKDILDALKLYAQSELDLPDAAIEKLCLEIRGPDGKPAPAGAYVRAVSDIEAVNYSVGPYR